MKGFGCVSIVGGCRFELMLMTIVSVNVLKPVPSRNLTGIDSDVPSPVPSFA